MRVTDITLIDALKSALEDEGTATAFCFIRVGKSSTSIKDLIDYSEKKSNTKNENNCDPPAEYFLRDYEMKEFSKLWRYLLTDAINILKWHDRREVSDDYKRKHSYKDWLESTFGNVAFGIDTLDGYFKEFVGFEQMLYGAEKFYRDHFLHVIRVWLTGILIITTDGQLKISDLVVDDKLARMFSIGSSGIVLKIMVKGSLCDS